MYYQGLINQIEDVIKKLQDDESRELYDARLEYYYERSEDRLQERVAALAPKYKDTFHCWGLKDYYGRHPENADLPFIVFGAGNMGRQTIRALRLLDRKIAGLVDNASALWGKEVCGIRVSDSSLLKQKDGIVVVAVSSPIQIGIYYQLLSMGVPETKIIMHQEGGLFLDYGRQYFDVDAVKPSEDGEVFIDAGCYDGLSSVNAAKWAEGRLEKVVAFEPDVNSLKKCEEKIKSIGCEYEIHNLATWDTKARLSFDIHENAGYGSRVSGDGTVFVEADSIDHVLDGKKATYIKLDVEGSELKTLQGAVETIRRWRPKLAISIYHKPEDIIEIPAFVENLDMDYKYYIRHYQSRIFETTLYAI